MSPEVIHRITSGVAAVAICACLAVGSLAFSSGAEARISGPRVGEQARICGWLQDQFDKYWRQYEAAPVGSSEEDSYLGEMLAMEGAWNAQGCNVDYGSIVLRLLPVKNLPNTGVIATASR